MLDELVIIGASGHARVIADIAVENNYRIIGYLDDDLSKPNVIGKVDDCVKYSDKKFIIAIGNNYIRQKIALKYPSLNYVNLIHPRAVVSSSVKMGVGNVIMPNAVVNAQAVLGSHCIINTSCVVEHENILQDFVHISPGATLCGNVRVGTLTHIGAGVTIKNNLNICDECIVGVGAAVVKNITEKGVYIGVPVKKFEKGR